MKQHLFILLELFILGRTMPAYFHFSFLLDNRENNKREEVRSRKRPEVNTVKTSDFKQAEAISKDSK